MREPWVAYLVTLSVVALMLLGKKMIFSDNSKSNDKDGKDEQDNKQHNKDKTND